MNRSVDPFIEKDINALMVCAPICCSRQSSCYRVARFARDWIRELHAKNAMEKTEDIEDEFVDQHSITRLYANTGSWESA